MEQNVYIEGIAQSLAYLGRYYAVTDAGQQKLNDCLIECAGGRSTYETMRTNYEGQECD